MTAKVEKKERPSPEWVEVSLPEGTGGYGFTGGRVSYRFTGPGPHKILRQDYERIPELRKLSLWTKPARNFGGGRTADTEEE